MKYNYIYTSVLNSKQRSILILKEANPNEPKRVGFVYLILHMKNGSKKGVHFVNGQMNTTSKKYIIVKNDSLDKIRKIMIQNSNENK